jgi:hypothetical protein
MRTLDQICDHTREEIEKHTRRKQAQMYNNAPIGTYCCDKMFPCAFQVS